MKTKRGPYSRAIENAADKEAKATPSPSARIVTETRNGVLHVIGRNGAHPVASPAIAQSFGGALLRAGLL